MSKCIEKNCPYFSKENQENRCSIHYKATRPYQRNPETLYNEITLSPLRSIKSPTKTTALRARLSKFPTITDQIFSCKTRFQDRLTDIRWVRIIMNWNFVLWTNEHVHCSLVWFTWTYEVNIKIENIQLMNMLFYLNFAHEHAFFT